MSYQLPMNDEPVVNPSEIYEFAPNIQSQEAKKDNEPLVSNLVNFNDVELEEKEQQRYQIENEKKIQAALDLKRLEELRVLENEKIRKEAEDLAYREAMLTEKQKAVRKLRGQNDTLK